jgi:succinate dehydrogenase / fumarate reductase cytochrome b subunit
MNWLIKSFSTSVGKKLLMAVTGLSFCLFLLVHLFGNMFIYVGESSFNLYVEHLHSLGFLVNLAEAGLVVFAVIHVITGLILYLQNQAARPTRYAVNKNQGGRTLGSWLMPYTGLYILVFVIIHLVTFKFADHTGTTTYDIVDRVFANGFYFVFYVVSMFLVALHISHGLWSGFQSLGLNHPKYMPAIQRVSLGFAVVVGVLFGFIPIFMLTV